MYFPDAAYISIILNNKWQTDIIDFDFDSVNHDKILKKLRHNYGNDGFLLRFIKGYLECRR